MRVSLVVATLGRVDALAALLDSLAAQRPPPDEVVVVDQNRDDRLVKLLAGFAGRLDLLHLRSDIAGLSRARNLALPHLRGDIVGFPDDDCFYPADVLAAVRAAFAADPALALLSGAAAAPSGGLGSGRWSPRAAPITRRNVWTASIAFTLFLRRDLLVRLGGFDERLGVGARFGAAEETDLVVRAIDAGAVARYDPALRVVHPDKRLTPAAAARAFGYGEGCGFVLRKHRFDTPTVATFLVRPLGGLLLALLRGRRLEASYYARTFAGRSAGYLAAMRRGDARP